MEKQLLEFEKCFEADNGEKQAQVFDEWLKSPYHTQEDVIKWKTLFINKMALHATKVHILKLYFNDDYSEYPTTTKMIINEFDKYMLHKFFLDDIFDIFKQYPQSCSKDKMELLFKVVRTYSNVITLPEASEERKALFKNAYQYTLDLVQTDKGCKNATSYIKEAMKSHNEDFLFSSKTALPYMLEILKHFKYPLAQTQSNWIYKLKQTQTIENFLKIGYVDVLNQHQTKTVDHLASLMKSSYYNQFEVILPQVSLSIESSKVLIDKLNELFNSHMGEVMKEKVNQALIYLEKNILEFQVKNEEYSIENKRLKL